MRGIDWNHTVRVYRETPGAGGAYSWQPQAAPAKANARPDYSWGGGQLGVGDIDGTRRMWFLTADTDVREGDVLSVTAGPEAPATWRALNPPNKPARSAVAHHVEVLTERFSGSLS